MVRDAVGRHPNVAGARREASPAERVQAARPLFDRLLTLPMREKMMSFVERLGEPMVSAYSRTGMQALMAAQGFETVENFPLPELGPRYREELGDLPLDIPSLFALGVFKVAARNGGTIG